MIRKNTSPGRLLIAINYYGVSSFSAWASLIGINSLTSENPMRISGGFPLLLFSQNSPLRIGTAGISLSWIAGVLYNPLEATLIIVIGGSAGGVAAFTFLKDVP